MNYIHQEPGQEMQPNSGNSIPIEELRLQLNGREVLCVNRISVADMGCSTCSMGISLDITVPGYILTWQARVNDAGLAVSVVEPVNDEKEKREIIAKLKETKDITSINFW
jgi:hypothetical protein